MLSTSVSCLIVKPFLTKTPQSFVYILLYVAVYKLDLDSTICSSLFSHFPTHCPDLNAQQEPPGQEAYGCAVIHPKVKLTLSPGSLLLCAAKPWRKRQMRGLARGRMLRNRMRLSARAQSTEMEGGTSRVTRLVVVVYRTLTCRVNGRSTRCGQEVEQLCL